jgi:Transposase DDE domain group 1
MIPTGPTAGHDPESKMTEPVSAFVETGASRATGTDTGDRTCLPNPRPSSTSISTSRWPIQVEVSDAPLTSNAGLLPLRQFDQRIGLTSQFAAALHDPRDPDLIDHTFPEMVRSRIFGILAGYEDQNDHDTHPPPAPAGDMPVAALPEPTRKQYQNARRRRDPLGEGQPATWRLLLIKVAASVVVSCRRIVVRLSGSWPHQQYFERVAQHVCQRPVVAHVWTG